MDQHHAEATGMSYQPAGHFADVWREARGKLFRLGGRRFLPEFGCRLSDQWDLRYPLRRCRDDNAGQLFTQGGYLRRVLDDGAHCQNEGDDKDQGQEPHHHHNRGAASSDFILNDDQQWPCGNNDHAGPDQRG